jgi:hypothetical protein
MTYPLAHVMSALARSVGAARTGSCGAVDVSEHAAMSMVAPPSSNSFFTGTSGMGLALADGFSTIRAHPLPDVPG